VLAEITRDRLADVPGLPAVARTDDVVFGRITAVAAGARFWDAFERDLVRNLPDGVGDKQNVGGEIRHALQDARHVVLYRHGASDAA
jgi:hypothetical protein